MPQMKDDAQVGDELAVRNDARIDSDAPVVEEQAEATPAAEKEAKKAKVDLAEVEGTGAGGKVTKADVEKAKQK